LDTLLGDLDLEQAGTNSRKASPTTNGATHAADPTALYVEAQLCAYGQTLGLPSRTRWASPVDGACTWSDWLTFPIKVVLGPVLPGCMHARHGMALHFIAWHGIAFHRTAYNART